METKATPPPPSPYLEHYRAALREQAAGEDFDEALVRVDKRLDPEGYAVTFAAQCTELDAIGPEHRAAAVSLVGEPLPPVSGLPTPVVLPSAPAVIDLNALMSQPGVHVTRQYQARVSLEFPQASVDKRGRLTPEQWARLMADYGEALGAYMQAGMEHGQNVSLGAAARAVPLPFAQVGGTLSDAEQQEMQQTIAALIPDVPLSSPPGLGGQIVSSVTRQISSRPRIAIGCGLLVLAFLLPFLLRAVLR
jgi:hypothetical protein